jgi:3-phenylpropionate/trans-cinnamate dioxygenase ferredoxin subunit
LKGAATRQGAATVLDGYIRVADTSDVTEGLVIAVEINGLPVALARSDGCVYAFEDRCSHQDCLLSTGIVSDSTIECEHHGAVFDLASGDVLLPPALEPIRVFAMVEDATGVFVKLGIENEDHK